jgi:hypothetical protein
MVSVLSPWFFNSLAALMNWNVDTPEGLSNAIAWTEQFLLLLGDKGTWAVPRSGSIIEIDKVNKRAVLLVGGPETSIQKVFEAMGWTWEDNA